MGKRTGKPRGRPSQRMMPPDIDATPEELARALFRAPPTTVVVAEPLAPDKGPESIPSGGRRGGDSNP